MAVIKRTQVIERPVEEVFAAIADAGNFASWNPTITASRRLDNGSVGNGSRFEWKLRGFGNVVQVFDEFEPNHQVRIVPQLRSLKGGHRFRLSGDGDSTRIDHELEMTPKGIFRLMTPIILRTGRKNLADTADALQSHLEGGTR